MYRGPDSKQPAFPNAAQICIARHFSVDLHPSAYTGLVTLHNLPSPIYWYAKKAAVNRRQTWQTWSDIREDEDRRRPSQIACVKKSEREQDEVHHQGRGPVFEMEIVYHQHRRRGLIGG